MNGMSLGVSLALLAATLAHADPRAPTLTGVGVRDYPWQAAAGEQGKALESKADPKRGAKIYALCRSCHLPAAGGQPDGSVPQLAGQHSTVLIKQMADIRVGLRHNPTMFPFAAVPTDPQDLADVAAYLEALCIPREHGRYEGQDAAQQIAKGKALYEKDCQECHGASGEGARHRVYPVIAGQHYRYLLRQLSEIRDGWRGNANPAMVEIISSYDDDQLIAVSAYQASLVTPGRMCKARGAARQRQE